MYIVTNFENIIRVQTNNCDAQHQLGNRRISFMSAYEVKEMNSRSVWRVFSAYFSKLFLDSSIEINLLTVSYVH